MLVGGLCVFGVNVGDLKYGVFIDCLGMLLNDFFVNLFDMCMEWKLVLVVNDVFEGCDCVMGVVKWMGMCVDLIFGLYL